MDLVLIRPDLQELDLISLFDVQTDVSEYLINGLVKDDSPVLCRKDQMVNQYGDIFDSCENIRWYSRTNFTPQATGNTIREI